MSPAHSPSSVARPDYSVIIPAFNEEELLPRTLASVSNAMESLEAWTGELIVVDNNSTDGTAAVARARGARVVFEPVNQISRARNRGAQEARGCCLVFVDADTGIPPVLLREALERLFRGHACGGGTRIGTTDPAGRGVRAALGLWNWFSATSRLAAGSFVFCLREAWIDTGGFPQSVYASEELFFSRAVRKWGRKRGLEFTILNHPVDTSMRKTTWYGPWQLLWMSATFILFPWRLRKRECCGLWYRRPDKPRGTAGIPPKTDNGSSQTHPPA